MGIEYKLTAHQVGELLYYETGFDQLHPEPSIINWMRTQGYVYNVDWFCKPNKMRMLYNLEFPNEEIAGLFILKWL